MQEEASPVDLAVMLFWTMQHLHTVSDVESCWRNIWHALKPGGILIIELPHFDDIFNGQLVEPMYWEHTSSDSNKTVIVEWGTEDDEFDAESQVHGVQGQPSASFGPHHIALAATRLCLYGP